MSFLKTQCIFIAALWTSIDVFFHVSVIPVKLSPHQGPVLETPRITAYRYVEDYCHTYFFKSLSLFWSNKKLKGDYFLGDGGGCRGWGTSWEEFWIEHEPAVLHVEVNFPLNLSHRNKSHLNVNRKTNTWWSNTNMLLLLKCSYFMWACMDAEDNDCSMYILLCYLFE